MSSPTTGSAANAPLLTHPRLEEFDRFLVEWDTTAGWPANAPLTGEQRNKVSEWLFTYELEITWLRVLGTILHSTQERNYLEVSVANHFQFFPQDVERMFTYWLRCPHLQRHGIAILQVYHAYRSASFHPALAAIIPLAETVMVNAGFKKQKGFGADYKEFFKSFTNGLGTKTAEVFLARVYESEPKGGLDNRERYNRHRLAHGISPDSVTWLDFLFGCLVLDLIVSTDSTGGQLLSRIKL